MNRRQVLFVVGVLFGAVLAYSPVFGQEDAAKRKLVQKSDGKQSPESAQTSGPAKREIRRFQLKEIEPGEAIALLADLLEGIQSTPSLRISPDPRTRSLIVAGDTEALKQVAALLQILDVPTPPHAQWEIQEGLNLSSNVSPSYAASLIEKWILKDGKISRSERGNPVYFTGPKAEADRARELIKELIIDLEMQPRPSISDDVQIRLVWLVESSLMDKNAAQVPSDLSAPIAKLAKKVGIGELRTAAQILVNVNRVDAKFKTAGTAALGEEYHLEFVGTQSMRTLKEHEVDVTISARRQGSDTALITQNTKIVTSLGRPVILGMTPIGSKASVFVVEILDNSSDEADRKPDPQKGASNTRR